MGQTHYTAFTINAAQVPTAQPDFPVLISVGLPQLRHTSHSGHVASTSGYDIRPYFDTALTTAYSFELVNYGDDGTNGYVEMWVKLSSASTGSTIYLAYGDTTLTSNASSGSTWDANFKAVYHLGNGTTLINNDSTGNAFHISSSGGATAGAGQIWGAATFGGTAQLTLPALGISGAAARTVSAWVNPSSTGSAQAIVWWGEFASTAKLFFFNSFAGGGLQLYANDFNVSSASGVLPASTWTHVAITYAGGTADTSAVKIYVNGVDQTLGVSGTATALNTTDANYAVSASFQVFSDRMDEIQFSNSVRSPDFMTAAYNNQVSVATFLAVGTEQSATAGVVYFGGCNSAGAPTNPFASVTNGFSTWSAAVDYVCPGLGDQNVDELSAYVNWTSGNPMFIRVAVYSADGTTLKAQGNAAVTAGTGPSWQGHIGSGAITQIAPLVGGTHYKLFVSFAGTSATMGYYENSASTSGAMQYDLLDYTTGAPASLPSGTNWFETLVRCGVVAATIGGDTTLPADDAELRITGGTATPVLLTNAVLLPADPAVLRFTSVQFEGLLEIPAAVPQLDVNLPTFTILFILEVTVIPTLRITGATAGLISSTTLAFDRGTLHVTGAIANFLAPVLLVALPATLQVTGINAGISTPTSLGAVSAALQVFGGTANFALFLGTLGGTPAVLRVTGAMALITMPFTADLGTLRITGAIANFNTITPSITANPALLMVSGVDTTGGGGGTTFQFPDQPGESAKIVSARRRIWY